MAKLMSVRLTEDAVRARRKTVTRRKGWWTDKRGRRLLLPSDELVLCREVMGRKPDEPLVRITRVAVTDVRREPLSAVTDADVYLEGFTDEDFKTAPWGGRYAGSPRDWFLLFFAVVIGITPEVEVTRIQWRYL